MRYIISIVVAVLFMLILMLTSAYIVDQRQQALVLQFGKFVKVVKDPGLHFKYPFIQNVLFYDNRLLTLDPGIEQVLLGDQKRINVNSYARYKIKSPLMFFKTVSNENVFSGRFGSILNSNVRKEMGKYDLSEVLGNKRILIMKEMTRFTNEEGKKFGVDVIDVRISRTDLPKDISDNVYSRMKSERIQEANLLRAEGIEKQQQIMAQADAEKTIILADAQKTSDTFYGEGAAQRTRILSKAYEQDLDFFAFYRSLKAYEKSFLYGSKTHFVFSSDDKFLKYIYKEQDVKSNKLY